MTTSTQSDREIIAGMGIMITALMLLGICKFAAHNASPHEWMTGRWFWAATVSFAGGGLIAIAGLRGDNTLSEEWISTVGVCGIISMMGAVLTSVISLNPKMVDEPIGLWQIIPLGIIAVVGLLVGWTAGWTLLFLDAEEK